MKSLFIFLLTGIGFFFSKAQSSDTLRLNQIQIIASHNSYKKFMDERVLKFLVKKSNLLGEENNPIALDYEHLPIDSQFSNYNVRGLELDINNDPKGGVFYKRKINAFVRGVKQKSGIEALKKPGMKLLHIKDVDYQTHYYTFRDALTALKKWSDENPNHLPLFINIESKSYAPADASGWLRFFGFKRQPKFDAAACDSIDAEIKSVFGDDLKNIITPDRLRRNFSSLDEMVKNNGWLTLSESRGKIIFIMEGAAVNNYIANHPSLQGRAAFVYSEPGKTECAFVKRNASVRDKEKIKELVRSGYIVRTRADAETWEARNNDYTTFSSALESGAQIISTDYYKADLRMSTYQVQLPNGGAGRSNPIISNGSSLEE